jgi:hypothetical protein
MKKLFVTLILLIGFMSPVCGAVVGFGSSSLAAKGGSELTKLGRWMSEAEFKQMSATGRVWSGC